MTHEKLLDNPPDTIYKIKNPIPDELSYSESLFYGAFLGAYARYYPRYETLERGYGTDRYDYVIYVHFHILNKNFSSLSEREIACSPYSALKSDGDDILLCIPTSWVEPLPTHEELMLRLGRVQLKEEVTGRITEAIDEPPF